LQIFSYASDMFSPPSIFQFVEGGKHSPLRTAVASLFSLFAGAYSRWAFSAEVRLTDKFVSPFLPDRTPQDDDI